MVVILQCTTNCLFCVPVFGLNTIMEIITEAGPVSNEGGFLALWTVHDIPTPSKHSCACLLGNFSTGSQYHVISTSHTPVTHCFSIRCLIRRWFLWQKCMQSSQTPAFHLLLLLPSSLLSLSHSHYCFLPMYDAIIQNMLLLFQVSLYVHLIKC